MAESSPMLARFSMSESARKAGQLSDGEGGSSVTVGRCWSAAAGLARPRDGPGLCVQKGAALSSERPGVLITRLNGSWLCEAAQEWVRRQHGARPGARAPHTGPWRCPGQAGEERHWSWRQASRPASPCGYALWRLSPPDEADG